MCLIRPANLHATSLRKVTLVALKWGGRVFAQPPYDVLSTEAEAMGWNGRFNGEDMGTGIYIYRIEFETASGSVIQRSGELTLIR